MRENLEKALKITLEFEGKDKLSNRPSDRGGLTKYGISQKAYPNLDIASLTRERAIELYIQDYWKPVRADDLPYPLDIICFDIAINHGAGTAARFLQSALNGVAPSIDPSLPRIKVDGGIGPITLGRLKWLRDNGGALAVPILVRDVLLRRCRLYARLTKDPVQRANIYGWMRLRVVQLGIHIGIFSPDKAI